jgi:cytochrome P450
MPVIRETLRLYPPAWVLERDAIEDDHVGGYVIPAKSIVIVSPYVTHRVEGLWPQPDTFQPERFLNGEKPADGSYIPFGLGPRSCIGAALASWEAIVLLAHLARRFRLEPVDPAPIPPEPAVTLRPGAPVRMRVRSRQPGAVRSSTG